MNFTERQRMGDYPPLDGLWGWLYSFLRQGSALLVTGSFYTFLPMNMCMASGWTPFVSCTVASISANAKTCATASAAPRQSAPFWSFMRTSTPFNHGGRSAIPGANIVGAFPGPGTQRDHANAWFNVAAICRWSTLSMTWIINGVPANGPNIFSYSRSFQTGNSQGFLNFSNASCASRARAFASAIRASFSDDISSEPTYSIHTPAAMASVNRNVSGFSNLVSRIEKTSAASPISPQMISQSPIFSSNSAEDQERNNRFITPQKAVQISIIVLGLLALRFVLRRRK